MEKLQWKEREGGNYGSILDNGEGKVFLSYQPNDVARGIVYSDLDSANPETAIVLLKDKKRDVSTFSPSMLKNYPDGLLPRFLIYRGDWRKELEAIYPDIQALKAHWKQFGGHFYTDNLED